MTKRKTWAAAAAMLALSGAAQSALINRGGGMIYDTTANITWLADMNYAYTSGYAASGVAPGSAYGENIVRTDGSMGWAAARNWADNLVYGGFSDWRLPTLNPSDITCSYSYDGGGFGMQYYGFNCTGGELSHLFVTNLGNKAFESVLDQTGDTAEQIANLALFSNVQSTGYWSSTEEALGPDAYAWGFSTFDGWQFIFDKGGGGYALAVRPGDVAATVPEPQTLALALMATWGAMAVRRKRPR